MSGPGQVQITEVTLDAIAEHVGGHVIVLVCDDCDTGFANQAQALAHELEVGAGLTAEDIEAGVDQHDGYHLVAIDRDGREVLFQPGR